MPCLRAWVLAYLASSSLVLIPQARSQPTNAAAYTWTTLAGRPAAGSANGIGGAAQFNEPNGVTVDTNGNIYVADFRNFTIRKITSAGVSSTIAGFPSVPGSADGTGAGARFNFPAAVAADSAGNLYVADSHNCTIRKLTPLGTNWLVSTIAGLSGITGTADGTNSDARFSFPEGIKVDSQGNLFVADGEANSVRKITPQGTNWVVTTIIAGLGTIGDVAVDANSNIYVTDISDDVIQKIIPAGASGWAASTIAGSYGNSGTNDGTSARFFGPSGITADFAGNLYVADSDNHSLRKLVLSGGLWVASTIAGQSANSGGQDGTGHNAQFDTPQGIAVDGSLNLYVTDSGNNTIRKCTSAGLVTTLAGQAVTEGATDGVGSGALFNFPDGIAVDGGGTLYVADAANNTIRIVSSAGQVSTIAGLPGVQGTNDGVGSNARFFQPAGVAFNGTIFVADYGNNTIRRITPAGTVSTIVGLPQFDSFGDPVGGSADGIGSNARFNGPQGIAISGGLVYVADSGNDTIRQIRSRFFLSVVQWTVTTIAGAVGQIATMDGTNGGARFYAPSGIAADNSGNLFVIGADSAIRKMTLYGTNWAVSTIATVPEQFVTPDNGIAVDSADSVYVLDYYHSAVVKVTPVGTNWVISDIGGMPGGFRGSTDGAGSAAQFNNPLDVAVDTGGNVYVADSGNDTIRKGVFAAYEPTNSVPYTPPLATANLIVTLVPPEAGGQWRFPWEVAWRDSGTGASNLAAGNYTIQFRNVPGFLTLSSNFVATVSDGATTLVTNEYYPSLVEGGTNTGALTVDIGPNLLSGSGWRFLGETSWRAAGSTAPGLLPDIYFIEFEPVSGYSRPSSRAVQVYAGLTTTIQAGYLLAEMPPQNVLLPVPVPAGQIGDLKDYPFGFNGQLQTDVGFGSGVAVEPNVVLTAAHLVFNDQTLAYVSQAYWYYRQEMGTSEPQPLSARGWYVLSGYAAQRTNDLLGGLAPDESSPQSRNVDVAAMYFLSSVAGGGSGGFLPSDTVPNQWLGGTSEKMLVGYPVDGSLFGDAAIVPGNMYQTTPEPYPLELSTDPVGDQQVYNATWFLSYPGNSGGPLYVLFNGYYYPAGVYLGTLYSGVVPQASAVRAIDSEVAHMIDLAQTQGDNGTNNTGGGVITIVPNAAVSAGHPGYIQWRLAPSSAVQAGAGWRLVGDAAFSSATNYTRAVLNTNSVAVEFKPVPGWNLPANQSISVVPDQITVYNAYYSVTNPVLVASPAVGIALTGTTGTTYRIESRTSLTSGNWQPVSTNTITSTGMNVVLPPPAANQPATFYRAVWLP